MTIAEGILTTPQLEYEYILSDRMEYIPYLLCANTNNIVIGGNTPRFLSFGHNNKYYSRWGYLRQGQSIMAYKTLFGNWRNENRPTRISCMTRYDINIYYSSLFIMEHKYNVSNVLMIGVVKYENAFIVQELLKQNDINVNHKAFKKLAPYIEIWIAENFDIIKSSHHAARGLYRRHVRKRLITSGLRIKIKSTKEINSLLVNTKTNFKSIDEMHTKINNLCQITASSKVLKLQSRNT